MTTANRLTVLVTGVGGGGHGHEVVKALRLVDSYRIVGVDMSASSFGLADVDASYTVPVASSPAYLATVLGICRDEGARALIHGSEPELRVMAARRDEIVEAGVLPLINDSELIATCMDKWATMRRLSSLGIPVPRSQLIGSEADAHSLEFSLPAVVKPNRGGGGSNNTYLAQDPEELAGACHTILAQGQDALVQEYLGTPSNEFTVGVLHSLDGQLVGSLALQRDITSGLSNRYRVANRTPKAALGPILAISSGVSQGLVADFPVLRDSCEAIAAALGSRGPLNIQCRFVDGTVYPFEINPRFSGTTHIRALVGFNEPDLLLRHHLRGEPLPASVSYRSARIVRGLAERIVDQ